MRPLSPGGQRAPHTPTPLLPLEGGGGPGGSHPLHHHLVPGLGWDGSFLASGPQAGPGSFLVPFLSPSKPSPWQSEKLVVQCPNLSHPPSPGASATRGRGWEAGSPLRPPASHNGAAFGLFLLEGGRDEFGTTGEVEQALGEAPGRALRGRRAGLVQTHHGCHPEDAVDALL